MNQTLSLAALREEFPSASPAFLYDIVCERMGSEVRWDTSPWTACSDWMDAFANAPSSYVSH